MGVTDLWKILAPVKDHCTLEDLRGQTLAVDLSIWVVEAEGVAQMKGRVTKPYLRNLFFRISHLQQLGVKLVFAVEGTAPELKWEAMAKRQQARFAWKGGAVRKANGGRSRFKCWLNECCELLDHMGVPYIQSKGEAEALCALLTKEKLVDGCITNDGDAFLYGATKVYRNFTMNTKDPHVEVYSMPAIQSKLGLDREKLVALGLLLGCDFCPKGVPGIGSTTAVKLMTHLKDISVLQRFRNWTKDGSYDILDGQLTSKVQHCSVCQHPGSSKDHKKQGCAFCGSREYCEPHDYDYNCECEWHRQKALAEVQAIEVQVRRKAIQVEGFPNQRVIDEFMKPKDVVSRIQLLWKRPNIFCFQRFMVQKLEWPEDYALKKILPLLTLYDLCLIRNRGLSSVPEYLKPHSIVKSRVRQGTPMYEIQWFKPDEDNSTQADYYVTLENQDLFSKCFPHLVGSFDDAVLSKKKPSKSTKKTKVKAQDEIEVTSQIESLDLSHPKTNHIPMKENTHNTKMNSKSYSIPKLDKEDDNFISKPCNVTENEVNFDDSFDLEVELLSQKAKKKSVNKKWKQALMTFSDSDDEMFSIKENLKPSKVSVKKITPVLTSVSVKKSHCENYRTSTQPKKSVSLNKIHGLEAVSGAIFDENVEVTFSSALNKSGSSEDEDFLPLSQRLLLRASHTENIKSDVRQKVNHPNDNYLTHHDPVNTDISSGNTVKSCLNPNKVKKDHLMNEMEEASFNAICNTTFEASEIISGNLSYGNISQLEGIYSNKKSHVKLNNDNATFSEPTNEETVEKSNLLDYEDLSTVNPTPSICETYITINENLKECDNITQLGEYFEKSTMLQSHSTKPEKDFFEKSTILQPNSDKSNVKGSAIFEDSTVLHTTEFSFSESNIDHSTLFQNHFERSTMLESGSAMDITVLKQHSLEKTSVTQQSAEASSLIQPNVFEISTPKCYNNHNSQSMNETSTKSRCTLENTVLKEHLCEKTSMLQQNAEVSSVLQANLFEISTPKCYNKDESHSVTETSANSIFEGSNDLFDSFASVTHLEETAIPNESNLLESDKTATPSNTSTPNLQSARPNYAKLKLKIDGKTPSPFQNRQGLCDLNTPQSLAQKHPNLYESWNASQVGNFSIEMSLGSTGNCSSLENGNLYNMSIDSSLGKITHQLPVLSSKEHINPNLEQALEMLRISESSKLYVDSNSEVRSPKLTKCDRQNNKVLGSPIVISPDDSPVPSPQRLNKNNDMRKDDSIIVID